MSSSICIVTVTLNAGSVLPRLIASLRSQTDRHFDFLVMDGASRDQTWQIVQSARDVVTDAVSEPDCGLYHALNKAISRIRTEYYLVMGADDVLDPKAIENYRSAVEASGADIVVAGVRKDMKIRVGYRRNRAWLGHSAMITSHSVGMLIRKSLHDRFGEYPLRYPILADGYMIKKMCTDPNVKTIQGDFLAGEFCTGGLSNRSFIKALCENWQIQLDTGEEPISQYVLFQMRLIKNLFKVVRRQ
jgi:glycosyltransferase involved in cell wall biosynthesis